MNQKQNLRSKYGMPYEKDSIKSWQLAVGGWQLAVGSWRLAVGSWQLAVGGFALLVSDL